VVRIRVEGSVEGETYTEVPMLNIVVLWNTVYFQEITEEMRAKDLHVSDADLARRKPALGRTPTRMWC
jgi:hypothetical protein